MIISFMVGVWVGIAVMCFFFGATRKGGRRSG